MRNGRHSARKEPAEANIPRLTFRLARTTPSPERRLGRLPLVLGKFLLGAFVRSKKAHNGAAKKALQHRLPSVEGCCKRRCRVIMAHKQTGCKPAKEQEGRKEQGNSSLRVSKRTYQRKFGVKPQRQAAQQAGATANA